MTDTTSPAPHKEGTPEGTLRPSVAAAPSPADLTDAIGQRHAPCGTPARLVSLVPSVTELLWDLGLGDQLVGRTGFCIHPREALRTVAKVGGTKDVNIGAVRALAPTHVVVNIDENRREQVDALASFVPHVIVTHPCQPEDNEALYRLLGGIFRRPRETEQLVGALHSALAVAHAARDALPPERVLYLIWREPWMTVSRSTYVAACLAAVGWRTWPAATGAGTSDDPRYPAFDWSADWLSGVDRVLLATEPYRFRERHLAEVATASGRPAHLVDGEAASWYGSRAIAGLRALATLRRRLLAGEPSSA